MSFAARASGRKRRRIAEAQPAQPNAQSAQRDAQLKLGKRPYLLGQIRSDLMVMLKDPANLGQVEQLAGKNALDFLKELEAASELEEASTTGGSLYYVFFRTSQDKECRRGWQVRFCKDLDKTLQMFERLKAEDHDVYYEIWNVRALALLHFEGRPQDEVVQDASSRGVKVAQRIGHDGREMPVLTVQQTWTPDKDRSAPAGGWEGKGLRPSWLWVNGDRSSFSYCASYVHVVAVLSDDTVRVNLQKDARAAPSSPSPGAEEDKGVLASAEDDYIPIGLFGVRHDQGTNVVDKLRGFAHALAAIRGVKSVKTSPRMPMRQDDAVLLVQSLFESYNNTTLCGKQAKEFQDKVVALLMQDKPVILYLFDKRGQKQQQQPPKHIPSDNKDERKA
jgi:hypothetical protein